MTQPNFLGWMAHQIFLPMVLRWRALRARELRYNTCNHNYNKIVKSDWLSTALISALIGQFNRTVRVMPK